MYALPNTLKAEIDAWAGQVSDFRNQKTEPVKFKAIRVPMGIYEQRQNDTYMVRVRCAGGMISPAQLNGVANIAEKTGSAPLPLHLTTRQELQIHNVALEQTPSVLRQLYELGLTSRGGGGNTVRNIMASEDAGVATDEIFDVTPYAVALTNILIKESDSWSLPRKYKIAFSGNNNDNANAIFNDLGFIASVKHNQKGFKVFMGGGLGSKPSSGHLLFDFLPDHDILYAGEAVKQLFSEHGNRRNRHKARIRHLFYKLGKEKVFELFFQYFNYLKNEGQYPLELPSLPGIKTTEDKTDATEGDTSFLRWKSRYVSIQKQPGLFSVEVPFEHGMTDAATLKALAAFLEPLGEDMLRLTMRQNIRLRNIPGPKLPALFEHLRELGIETEKPRILNNLVACTGADTCRLGVCLAKGASSAIRKSLQETGETQLDALSDVRINLSGCPNSCGQHSVANLGFYGKASRNDRLFPAYYVTIGGETGVDKAQLGVNAGEISARDIPAFTRELLLHYTENKNKYSGFNAYLAGDGKNDIENLLAKYKTIPSFEEDKNYYFDWGAQELFSLKGKGKGECSAGMFDMIDFDYEAISTLKKELQTNNQAADEGEILRRMVFHASRMLLVTRGIEPVNRDEVFGAFLKDFIDAGHVDARFSEIVENARAFNDDTLKANRTDVFALASAIFELYRNMDDSLQFKSGEKPMPEPSPTREKVNFSDFRGVACPMNFVKTKIELSKISQGELLEILLDDGPPIENVPGSVQGEGHEVIETIKKDDHWSVLICKS